MSRKWSANLVSSVLVILAAAPAITVSEAPALGQTPGTGGAGVPKFAIDRYRLPNGLEVILHEDHALPLVHINIWYHVGSGDERPDRSGLAHFCEHMMFEGSRHIKPGEHFQVLGVAGNADANATTDTDRTNYFETLPASDLETGLWLESDRMSYLIGSLDQSRFDNQREVVRNERRQRLENVPFGVEALAIGEALYPEGHPYRHLTIGLHEDIMGATLDDATTFFRRWYGPGNATLLIAGDFEHDTAKALVAKWFGTLPGAPKPVHRAVTTPPLRMTIRMVVHDPFTQLRRIHYVWRSATAATDAEIAVELLARILGDRPLGLLTSRLVYREQLAENVYVYEDGRGRTGELHVIVDLQPNADLAKAEGLLRETLDNVARLQLPDEWLEFAVVAREVEFLTALETLSARAYAMQYYNHFRGDPDSFGWDLLTARSFTTHIILATAAHYLTEPRVEVITMPGAGG